MVATVIYQAIGYKRLRDSAGASYLHPTRRGQRTIHLSVAMAETDHLSQRYPDLVWNTETVPEKARR